MTDKEADGGGRRQRAEGGRRMAEGGRQTAEGGGQSAEREAQGARHRGFASLSTAKQDQKKDLRPET